VVLAEAKSVKNKGVCLFSIIVLVNLPCVGPS